MTIVIICYVLDKAEISLTYVIDLCVNSALCSVGIMNILSEHKVLEVYFAVHAWDSNMQNTHSHRERASMLSSACTQIR